jgi:hypothetical protein
MKLKFSRQIFEKSSDIEFNQNPSSGSRVVPCGQTEKTELIVAFRDFVNVSKNSWLLISEDCSIYENVSLQHTRFVSQYLSLIKV